MAFLLGWILLAGSGARAQMTATTRQAIVDGHNSVRGGLSTPSMIELVYDMDLECVAQAYINTQTISSFAHNPNRQSQYVACGGSASSTVGENWFSGDPSTATNAWVDMLWGTCSERMDYNGALDANGNSCAGGTTGHYTQVTWSSTARVGCGYTAAGGTVCDYSPAGNWVGQNPYVIGTPCSACPAAYPVCSSGLCTTGTTSSNTSSTISSPVTTSSPATSPKSSAVTASSTTTSPKSSPAPSPSSSPKSSPITVSSSSPKSSPIIVSSSSPKSSSATASPSPVSCPMGWSWRGNGGPYYVAVKGDTCASVAAKYGITLATFQAENSGVVCSCPLMAGQYVNVGSSFLEEENESSIETSSSSTGAWKGDGDDFRHGNILPPARSRSKAQLAFTRAGLKV